MNAGQEKFHQYIIERVNEGEKEQAEELLKESFQKQENGTFNQEYLQGFMPKLISLLKPEYIEDVRQTMEGFARNINQ